MAGGGRLRAQAASKASKAALALSKLDKSLGRRNRLDDDEDDDDDASSSDAGGSEEDAVEDDLKDFIVRGDEHDAYLDDLDEEGGTTFNAGGRETFGGASREKESKSKKRSGAGRNADEPPAKKAVPKFFQPGFSAPKSTTGKVLAPAGGAGAGAPKLDGGDALLDGILAGLGTDAAPTTTARRARLVTHATPATNSKPLKSLDLDTLVPMEAEQTKRRVSFKDDEDDMPLPPPNDDDDDDAPAPAPAAAAAGAAAPSTKAAPTSLAERAAAAASAASADAAATAQPSAGWLEVVDASKEADDEAQRAAAAAEANEKASEAALAALASDEQSLPVDTDKTLPFYLIDAVEEGGGRGGGSGGVTTVSLFGKVPVDGGKSFASCCVRVEGLQRCVFAIPKPEVFGDDGGEADRLEAEIAAAEQAVGKTSSSEDDSGASEAAAALASAKDALSKHLHAKCASLKSELRALLGKHGISNYTMSPVKRTYAFENPRIPRGEQYVVKIRYPASLPCVPFEVAERGGSEFICMMGSQTSLLENLMVKRKLMGPSWLSLASPTRIASTSMLSWCKLEVAVPSAKHVSPQALPAASGETRAFHANSPAPPLVVASLHVKATPNDKDHTNEVAAVSVLYHNAVRIDSGMEAKEWMPGLRHFTAVRRIMPTVPFPPGFDAHVKDQNEKQTKRNGGIVLSAQGTERNLLAFFLAKMQQIDPDVIVGHNVGQFELEVLLHRMNVLKVPNWSRIGRVRRSRMPNLGNSKAGFGQGASYGVQTSIAGRLLCDTWVNAREFVTKAVSYGLTNLANTLLGEKRDELQGSDVKACYASSDRLQTLVGCCISDAFLSLKLMFHLNSLPLTRQLASLSGFQWSTTLQSQRARRIEFLLLHEFHARKFLLPDKQTAAQKAKAARIADGDDGDEEDGDDGDAPKSGGRRKKAAYAGGLVLEPKKGLYDKFVLLLDFNSLYPSIIQEYHICFTTVERNFDATPDEEGANAPLPGPGSEDIAVLPTIIRKLVERRRQVKDLMKRENDPLKKSQLDIRQLAIKITANSMYGCLGFSASRFYAKPLAQLITSQGREALQNTVDLVRNQVGLDVIYGDTDSIMIHTGADDLAKVMQLGYAVKKEVNKRYRCMEIDIDGVYKSMLLLKKKKYAALVVDQNLPNGEFTTKMETKGLDIVRRDWCPLAKDAGHYSLSEVLSGKSAEDIVHAIHTHLRELKEFVESGSVSKEKFVITKQLTKRPEDYPDAANQPHVQVALSRRRQGRTDCVAAGETIPYIICREKSTTSGAEGGEAAATAPAPSSNQPLAKRAFHPDEVVANGPVTPDAAWYLSNQVHPVVSRLCDVIEGTDAAQLAECLGLDAHKYRQQIAARDNVTGDGLTADAALGTAPSLDDDDRFRACEPLVVAGKSFVGTRALVNAPDTASSLVPANAAALSNAAVLASRAAIGRYYSGLMRSEDEAEASATETRDVSLREVQNIPLGSASVDPRQTGKMVRAYTEAQLYTQLSHYVRLLDVDGALDAKFGKVPSNSNERAAYATTTAGASRATAAQALAVVRRTLDSACTSARHIRSESAYRYVNLKSMLTGC